MKSLTSQLKMSNQKLRRSRFLKPIKSQDILYFQSLSKNKQRILKNLRKRSQKNLKLLLRKNQNLKPNHRKLSKTQKKR